MQSAMLFCDVAVANPQGLALSGALSGDEGIVGLLICK